MNIKIIGSTNNIKNKEDALKFAQSCGRVCYSEKNFEEVNQEKSTNVLERLLNSGHHSPFDHIMFNLEFSGIPKIGAMILNNEKFYVTSEKSARYTKMELSEEQEKLYEKWKSVFSKKIKEKYSFLDDVKINKLAQENARYLTSVFTPTHLVYTTSFRQLNYFVHWFEDFMNTMKGSFSTKLFDFMSQFNNTIKNKFDLFEKRLDPKIKKRKLSLFSDKREEDIKEEFGETYSTTYEGSFAQLAQAHRHRILNYEILQPIYFDDFFVPSILKEDSKLVNNWIKDINSVSSKFPQGTLISIHEKGNYKDFISKATERLCEHAQWEIMNQTKKTLDKYINSVKSSNKKVYLELLKYSKGPKCTFPEVYCQEPGPFGAKRALERII